MSGTEEEKAEIVQNLKEVLAIMEKPDSTALEVAEALDSITSKIADQAKHLLPNILNEAGMHENTVAKLKEGSASWFEKLTPEIAKRFVEMYQLTEEELSEGDSMNDLSFRNLRELPVEVAKELAKYYGEIDLTGLKKLSPEAAMELVDHKGYLSFGNLENLDVELAKILGMHEGGIGLMNEIDKEKLKLILGNKKRKALEIHMAELDEESATLLANGAEEQLFLSGIRTLNPKTAKILATSKVNVLYLSSLTRIDAATAEAFSHFQGAELSLQGLTSMDDASAEKLSAGQFTLLFAPKLQMSDKAKKLLN